MFMETWELSSTVRVSVNTSTKLGNAKWLENCTSKPVLFMYTCAYAYVLESMNGGEGPWYHYMYILVRTYVSFI